MRVFLTANRGANWLEFDTETKSMKCSLHLCIKHSKTKTVMLI